MCYVCDFTSLNIVFHSAILKLRVRDIQAAVTHKILLTKRGGGQLIGLSRSCSQVNGNWCSESISWVYHYLIGRLDRYKIDTQVGFNYLVLCKKLQVPTTYLPTYLSSGQVKIFSISSYCEVIQKTPLDWMTRKHDCAINPISCENIDSYL